MKFFKKLFLFFIIFIAALAGPMEKLLLKKLFDPNRPDAHNIRERPVEDHNKSVIVQINFILFQITEVNERSQYISSILWVDMYWNDPHLYWKPAEYANISQINLPSSVIWKPTLLLYTSANQNFDQKYPCHAVIKMKENESNIQWMPPGLMYSTCQMNVAWFPFDNQECVYKFGTWSYNEKEINLTNLCNVDGHHTCPVDLSSYSKHSEWALETAYSERKTDIDNGQKFSVIEVTYKMQRRALYYLFNLIAPCMVISIMALLVFALPPDANEKISLGVTILLSLTLFLQMVANKLPQTSESIPILSIYFCVTMCISSLSLVVTVILLNCRYHPSDIHTVPWWIDVLVNQYIARILFMPIHKWDQELESAEKSKVSRVDSWKNISNENIEFRPLSIKKYNRTKNYEYDNLSLLSDESGKYFMNERRKTSNIDYACQAEMEKKSRDLGEPKVNPHIKCSMSGGIHDLELILNEVRFITEKLRELNQENSVSACWKYANKVLDRFCLVIFSLFLFGTFIILPMAPKFIKSFTIEEKHP